MSIKRLINHVIFAITFSKYERNPVMQFISQNTALVQSSDLINNTFTLPEEYDVSFTVNDILIFPETTFQNNTRIVRFNNLSNDDVIHCFFHNPVKGVKNNSFPDIVHLLQFYNPNSIQLFSKNYQPRTQSLTQDREIKNLSNSDDSYVSMSTANHVSFKNDTTYPAFIPANTDIIPVFSATVDNVAQPLQMQFFFYDRNKNLIEKVSTVFQDIEESSSSGEESSSSAIEEEIVKTIWTCNLEINPTLHQKLLDKGIETNSAGQKTYYDLFWQCRYTVNIRNGVILWRNYSPMISFRINEPPTPPINLDIT